MEGEKVDPRRGDFYRSFDFPNHLTIFPHDVIQLSSIESMSSRSVYRQALGLLRQTSRASNPDWYRDAMDVPYQWHLVVQGGNRVQSVLLAMVGEEATWLPGPALQLTTPPTFEQIEAMLAEIQANPDFRKAKSLGVIVHLADEFAATEIFQEPRSAAAMLELREEVRVSPATALGDPSLTADTTATRLVPYAGASQAPMAAVVSLSKTHDYFLTTLRAVGNEHNFPIRAMATSAPLVFLSILPAFLQFQPGKPQFVLLHYARFSTLAVFNPDSNLVQLRALPHRGRAFPGNLGDAINTALDSLDLHDPVITILPLGDTDPSPLLTQLHATLNQPEKAETHILRPTVDSLAPGVPDLRPEMLVSVPQFASGDVSPGFKQLFTERWAMQDFLPEPEDQKALYPGQTEMKLLAFSRVLLALLSFALVGLLALGIFSMLKTVNDPAWRHDPAANGVVQERLNKASQESREFDHWENLLQPRARAWTSMELLARVFPENCGVVVSNFKQGNRLDSTIKNFRLGFTREWVIDGVAEEKAVALLNHLNGREGMKALFDEVHKATGNDSFDTSKAGRAVVALMERSKNPGFVDDPGLPKGDRRRFPYVFTLKITQVFPSEDPMAITTVNLLPL